MRQRKKVIMKTMAAGEGACISGVQSGKGMEHQPHLPEGQMGTGTGSTHTHPLQPLPLLKAPEGFHTLLMSSCASLAMSFGTSGLLCPVSTLCNGAEPREHWAPHC